jgi:predicted dinucleotide-binding enzyme
MRIAVIGSGDMGGALALAFSRRHDVTVAGSRPGSESAARVVAESGGRVREAAARDAAERAELAVFSVPWHAVGRALDAGLVRALRGKILLVVTLPWNTGDSLEIGTTTSGAEVIASKAPGARVVQAFNTVASATVAAPAAHGLPATVFVSGDDAPAKQVVAGLALEIGFDVVDAGPLRGARYTEPMAMLYAQLAYDGGLGEDVAFRVLHGAPVKSPADE